MTKGGNMLKLCLTCLLIAVVALLLPGCGPDKNSPPDTELAKMLAYIPYSFVEEHDIWFGNPEEAKALAGLEDLETFEESEEVIRQLPGEQGMQFVHDWGTAAYFSSTWNRPGFASLTGFDIMTVDRVLCGDVIPPHGFFILKGDFDETLIGQKLTEAGYTKTDYGQHSYYSIRDDYEIDIRNPLGRIVLASMNRVAVMDDLIITSPSTTDITGIFDTMDGDSPAAIGNAVCRALADSLGDVLAATITTPERIIFTDLAGQQERPMMFDFIIPAEWGTLQGYKMAALGYRADGDARFLDIALYYKNKETAEADGQEILKRMGSYTLNTWEQNQEISVAFTERFQPGEPEVEKYGEGVVLKISCQMISEDIQGVSTLLGGSGMPFRDLLFLATEPGEYIGKNE
jgi:hypothetical protein